MDIFRSNIKKLLIGLLGFWLLGAALLRGENGGCVGGRRLTGGQWSARGKIKMSKILDAEALCDAKKNFLTAVFRGGGSSSLVEPVQVRFVFLEPFLMPIHPKKFPLNGWFYLSSVGCFIFCRTVAPMTARYDSDRAALANSSDETVTGPVMSSGKLYVLIKES
jgi:hypothetical protein